jgi:hypothetical protein
MGFLVLLLAILAVAYTWRTMPAVRDDARAIVRKLRGRS